MSGVLPRGACDCHCHVFGPAARFPYAEPRSYTPDDAPLEAYLALLDRLGFDRGVLVQPSAYGRDNRAMLDALAREPKRLRGVAVGGAELTRDTLKAMACGRRARPARQRIPPRRQALLSERRDGSKDIEPLYAAARRSRLASAALGRRPRPARHGAALARIPVPVVVDHMGRMEYHHGTHHPGFQALLRGVGEGRLWAKLSGTYRLGATPPDYLEAKPFHDALVAANPQNLVWGTDWPHPRPEGPGAGRQTSAAMYSSTGRRRPNRQAILTDNPARLYDFQAKTARPGPARQRSAAGAAPARRSRPSAPSVAG